MTTTYPPATVPLPADLLNPPHPRRSRGRIGLVVIASIAAGTVTALGLTLGVFNGAPEHVVTGVALLSFALG